MSLAPPPTTAEDLALAARVARVAAWEAHGGPEAEPALLGCLLDPAEASPARRLAAFAYVRRVGGLALARRLGLAWPEVPPEQRALVVELCAALGDLRLVPLFTEAALDEDREVRSAGLRALTELAEASTARALEPLCEHPDPVTRVQVGRLLARVGGAVAVRGCSRLLADPEWHVRRDTCVALREHPVPGVTELLLARLADREERSEVRFKAVEALAASGERQVLSPLILALEDPDPAVSSTAAHHLGQLRDSSALEPLVRYLRASHDSEYAHAGAAISLGRLGDPAAVPALKQALQDGREAVRQWSAEALGRLGAADAVGALIGALDDPSEQVRAQAARALGRLGSRQAVGPLLDRLGEEAPLVRVQAAAALGALGDALACEGLLEAAAAGEREEVRVQAITALGRVGRGSPSVGAGLLALLQDGALGVRRAAAQALGGLGLPELLPRLRALMRPGTPLLQDRLTWLNLLGSRARLGEAASHEALRRLVAAGGEPGLHAALRLATLRDPGALPLCVEASRSVHWDLRLQAVEALATLADPRSLPALRARTRDRHLDVREAALAAILRVEQG